MRTIIVATLFLGCSSNKETAEDDATPPTRPSVDLSCDDDTECDAHQICEDSACADGDRSNDFSEAIAIAPGDGEMSGHINVDGDLDYWSYSTSGSEFITAKIINDNWAEIDDESDPDALRPDVYLTLYDPDGDIVTSADDFPNGDSISNFDSVVFAYLESPGTYTFVVEDANAKNNRGDRDAGDYDNLYGENYAYSIVLYTLTGTKDRASSLEDPLLLGPSEATGIQIKSEVWKSLGVLIDEPGQTDYVAVLLDNDNLNADWDVDPEGEFYTWDGGLLTVAGLQDLRGSNATPAVQILSPDDEILSTGRDVGPSQTIKYGALTPGQYVLALSDLDGGGGPNHWYFVLLRGDNPSQNIPFEEENNNSQAAANPISVTDRTLDSGQRFSQGSIQGFVNNAGDNDWFSMSAPEDAVGDNSIGEPAQWVVVCANSTLWGSSATPRITIYDEGFNILAESETDVDGVPNVRIENVEIQPGEQINVQVNAGIDSEGHPDEWYRMKVFIAGFEVKPYEEGGYVCP